MLHPETVLNQCLIPFTVGLKKISGTAAQGSSLELMTSARLALGRDIVRFRNMHAASAHELAFGVSIFFIRLWNRRAKPEPAEPPMSISGPWQILLHPPQRQMDLEVFLDEAHQCFHDYNPTLLGVELKLEYAKAKEMLKAKAPDAEFRIQRNGGIWQLRYQNESADYYVNRNKSLAWLAKLLAVPNRALAVADLRGDPETKLAGDALLRDNLETDFEGLANIRRRLQDVDDIIEETGGSEALQNERAALLENLKTGPWAKVINTGLRRDHANIATQLRNLRHKLESDMPNLAAHLKSSLKMNFPEFGYYPPDPAPNWQF
jgi:hypothetical protein